MFSAAVYEFSKEIADPDLIPSPNLVDAAHCQVFHTVLKENPRWFWQKAVYKPSPYRLEELLWEGSIDSKELEDIKSTRKLTKYDHAHTFAANGKIGGMLKSLFDLELSGSATFNVKANFGDISIDEVDQSKFRTLMKDKRINLEHAYVKEAQEQKNNVLCVIVGSAYNVSAGTVTTKVEENEGMKGDVVDEKIDEADESVDNKNQESMTVEPKTPLAYLVLEILVKEDGSIVLSEEHSHTGGFEALKGHDEDTNSLLDKDAKMTDQFKAIIDLDLEERQSYSTSMLTVCQAGHQEMQYLLDMLNSAIQNQEIPQNLEKMKRKEEALILLKKAGFSSQEQMADLRAPSGSPSKLLQAMAAHLEALLELDDLAQDCLLKCGPNETPGLVYLLESALASRTVETTSKHLHGLYMKRNPGQALVEALGFQITNGTQLTAALNNRNELEAALRSVYAFWWLPDQSSKCCCCCSCCAKNCAIL